MNAPRPFRQDDAPGRIPESLIDAVFDGAVDDRTRREVSRALRHDATRQRDVRETMEALEALRAPVECPDLTGGVLGTLDRKHRFIPARARRAMRQTRLGLGLAALLALGAVAVGQRAIPRLASIGTPSTPVIDVAQAIQSDAGLAASGVRDGAQLMCASVPLLGGGTQGQNIMARSTRVQSTLDRSRLRAASDPAFGLTVPGDQSGHQYRFEIDHDHAGGIDWSGYRMVMIDGGRLILLGSPIRGTSSARCTPRVSSVSLVTASYGWETTVDADAADSPDEPASDAADAPAGSGRGGWVAEELP